MVAGWLLTGLRDRVDPGRTLERRDRIGGQNDPVQLVEAENRRLCVFEGRLVTETEKRSRRETLTTNYALNGALLVDQELAEVQAVGTADLEDAQGDTAT